MNELDIDIWCNQVRDYYLFTPKTEVVAEHHPRYGFRKCRRKSEITGIGLRTTGSLNYQWRIQHFPNGGVLFCHKWGGIHPVFR